MANSAADLREDLATDDGDDRIYEEIEAPKFVDFSAPDKSRPDDSSWFCARIGCNQQHEEIDPEALHKSFVLRVLAARSPNIRLQKALSMHAQSRIQRCPRTAPAKSEKDGVQKLSTVSLIPQKIKAHPISSLRSTPVAEISKQDVVSSKSLMTPITKKKCPTGAEAGRSVHNPKLQEPISAKKPAVKFVAFGTEKKPQKDAYGNCYTPISEMCSGMNKLQISSSQTKNGTRHLSSFRKGAAARATGLVSSKSVNMNREASPKQEQKDQQVMDIGEKSHDRSSTLPGIQGNQLEEDPHQNDATNSEKQTEKIADAFAKAKEEVRDNTSTSDKENSSILGEKAIAEIRAPSSCDSESFEIDKLKGKIGDDDYWVRDNTSTSDKENSSILGEKAIAEIRASCDSESFEIDKLKGKIGDDDYLVFDDNKENAPGNHEGDKNSIDTMDHENQQYPQKSTEEVAAPGKTLTAIAVQGQMPKKMKKTNPKPFRFRTDERGILREANLEKKLRQQSFETIRAQAKSKRSAGGPLTSITPQRRKHIETDSGASKPKKMMKLAASPQTPNGTLSTISTTKSQLTNKGSNYEKGARAKTPNRVPTNHHATTNKTTSPWTRKPSTVPREPNFHRIHIPKCCTKRLENILV